MPDFSPTDAPDLTQVATDLVQNLLSGAPPIADDSPATDGPSVVDGVIYPAADDPKAVAAQAAMASLGEVAAPDTPETASSAPPPAPATPATEAPPADQPPSLGEPDADGLFVVDAAHPNIKFAVMDSEGEALVPPEGLSISFKADGGKKFEQKSLAEVVQLAQRGVYNQRLHDEVAQLRSSLPEINAHLAALEEQVQLSLTEAQRLLEDDEYLLARREQYAHESSPEARAERAERALEANRVQTREAQAQSEAAAVIESEIAPAIEALLDEDFLTWEELWGRMDQFLTPHKRADGVIPPEKAPAILRRVLENELTPWAQDTVAKRTAKFAAAKGEVAAADRARQQAEEQAKRQQAEAAALGRKTFVRRSGVAPAKSAPSGAGVTPPAAKTTAPLTHASAADSILSAALGSIAHG
jgi:hypothetical protein